MKYNFRLRLIFLMYVKLLFFVMYYIYSNDFSFYKIGGLGSLVKFDKFVYILGYMLEYYEI